MKTGKVVLVVCIVALCIFCDEHGRRSIVSADTMERQRIKRQWDWQDEIRQRRVESRQQSKIDKLARFAEIKRRKSVTQEADRVDLLEKQLKALTLRVKRLEQRKRN